MSSKARWLSLLLLSASAVVAGPALADDDDPPALVGRVAYVEGAVSYVGVESDDWAPVSRNFPVAERESFWTDRESRAELQVGPVQLRLDQMTELDVDRLDYGVARYNLARGVVDIRMWRMPDGGVTIITPRGEVRLERAGVYRIDATAGNVEVTTLEGLASVDGPGGAINISRGQAAILLGGQRIEIAAGQTAYIDEWSRRREAETGYGRRPDSTDYAGIEDLDSFGRWQAIADYDRVWFPDNVPQDWAPYRYGEWTWVQPWGWTWVDDAPWGFTPFHYGRWVQVGGRWGWCPGRPAPRPVYAPALVAFIGGSDWSVSLRSGGRGPAVGWVPLAPDEVYRPSYHVSPTYVRQVNITNVNETIINRTVINGRDDDRRRFDNPAASSFRNSRAATVVDAHTFGGHGPVQSNAMRVAPEDLFRARVAADPAVIAPPPQPRTDRRQGEAWRRPPTAGAAPQPPVFTPRAPQPYRQPTLQPYTSGPATPTLAQPAPATPYVRAPAAQPPAAPAPAAQPSSGPDHRRDRPDNWRDQGRPPAMIQPQAPARTGPPPGPPTPPASAPTQYLAPVPLSQPMPQFRPRQDRQDRPAAATTAAPAPAPAPAPVAPPPAQPRAIPLPGGFPSGSARPPVAVTPASKPPPKAVPTPPAPRKPIDPDKPQKQPD